MSVVTLHARGFPVAVATQYSGRGGGGGDMEARIAKLEAGVEHIQSNIADIKADVRAIRDKLDGVKDSLGSAKVWALLIAGAILGVMARGFGWI